MTEWRPIAEWNGSTDLREGGERRLLCHHPEWVSSRLCWIGDAGPGNALWSDGETGLYCDPQPIWFLQLPWRRLIITFYPDSRVAYDRELPPGWYRSELIRVMDDGLPAYGVSGPYSSQVGAAAAVRAI